MSASEIRAVPISRLGLTEQYSASQSLKTAETGPLQFGVLQAKKAPGRCWYKAPRRLRRRSPGRQSAWSDPIRWAARPRSLCPDARAIPRRACRRQTVRRPGIATPPGATISHLPSFCTTLGADSRYLRSSRVSHKSAGSTTCESAETRRAFCMVDPPRVIGRSVSSNTRLVDRRHPGPSHCDGRAETLAGSVKRKRARMSNALRGVELGAPSAI